jgi:beta-N-acetylhexosaminidase
LICQQIENISPAGIVYRAGNVNTPNQLREFSTGLQNCAQTAGTPPLLLALDHEGQYVNRFNSGVTFFPIAMAQGASGDPSSAYQIANLTGGELRYSGVNMVLGPVADVLLNPDNSVISLRSFGGDSRTVSAFVSQAVQGYQDAGLIPVVKHYPGHGGTAEDSHNKLPVDYASTDSLYADYLPPFIAGIDAGAQVVMTSHVAFPEIDPDGNPATLSEPVLEILKEDLNFTGVVLTDSMGMGAIKTTEGSVAQASLKAVQRGADLLLITSPTLAQGVHQALFLSAQKGELSQERLDDAVARILILKAENGLMTYPVDQAQTPDWNGNASQVYKLSRRMVTLYRDQADLVPIPTSLRNILLVGPPDGWGLYPVVESALRDKGHSVRRVNYPGPWNGKIQDGGLKNSILSQANGYDLVIVLTWESHLNRVNYKDDWQTALVQELLGSGVPLIVVALKSPTDLLDFPDIPTYLATFGTTSGQIRGLAEILTGQTDLTGVNPLPQLKQHE